MAMNTLPLRLLIMLLVGARMLIKRVHTKPKNLRKILFVDDCGGWKGYCSDVKSLWTDNRDPSHASLYYMLLRTALIGQNSTVLSDAVWRACGLNLLLFAVSFVLMAFFAFQNFSKLQVDSVYSFGCIY